jgi:NhaP-type Na+/H+ or K+/H+ antiporter
LERVKGIEPSRDFIGKSGFLRRTASLAIAASAIVERLFVLRRIVTILEGESLVNDATALVAYRFAVIAVLTGPVSWASISFQ